MAGEGGTIALKPISIAELQAGVGKEAGVSPWRAVTQRMIDQFADATDVLSYPDRARRLRGIYAADGD